MLIHPERPLIVQSDRTLLLEVQHPLFVKAREELSIFAELVKSPEYIHTYSITQLSLWNAAASGLTAAEVVNVLHKYSKFTIPKHLEDGIKEYIDRYGLIQFVREDGRIICKTRSPEILQEILSYKSLLAYFDKQVNETTAVIVESARGILKQELLKLAFPVEDLAGYHSGERLGVSLLPTSNSNQQFKLRDYQLAAISAFYRNGSVYGGSGVLVLPCGSGKTVIGLGVMAEVKSETLILTTNTTSVRQWIKEILDKTTLSSNDVGEYSGAEKQVKPVTVATYQILTHRSSKEEDFKHMGLFQQRNWGLIIYDEVHLLPAPVFRYTAGIQATRRLGLTATLVREDKKEDEVFSLIGPKKYDVPWMQMESLGWIAEAVCTEIRLPLSKIINQEYLTAPKKQKYKIAATNPQKLDLLKDILKKHENDSILIIGQYLDQLAEIAESLNVPLITGKVKQEQRDELYRQFKDGRIKVLAVSKVANFAIDLPDAKVAIQVSGTFGSRQEEAQRLGRILRPKAGDNQAFFYTIVSQNTIDQEYAMKRQLFLIEQGYSYHIQEKG